MSRYLHPSHLCIVGKQEIYSGPYVVNDTRAHTVAFPRSVLWRTSIQCLVIADVIMTITISSRLERECLQEEPHVNRSIWVDDSTTISYGWRLLFTILQQNGCISLDTSGSIRIWWDHEAINVVECSLFALEIIVLTMIRVYWAYRERECLLLDILLQHNIFYFGTGLGKYTFMAVKTELIFQF
jgi:hypothetical protein